MSTQLAISWSLEEQLREDWGKEVGNTLIFPLSFKEYVLFTPSNNVLIYSLMGLDWVSRTIDEYIQELSVPTVVDE